VSDDSEFERFKTDIQSAILLAYPNPERKGCPGSQVLQTLAGVTAHQVLDPAAVDPENAEHILHCSPCYAEYLELRRKAKESR